MEQPNEFRFLVWGGGGEEGGEKRVNRRTFQLKEGEEISHKMRTAVKYLLTCYFLWSGALSDLNDLS